MKKMLLLAAATLCIAATPALAANRHDRICIQQGEIDNWKALSDKRIVIEDRRHRKALLKLIGTCSGFNFSEALAIRSPGASYLSCVAVGDTIITHTSGLEGRCAVTSVTPYTGNIRPHHGHDDDNDGDDSHHDGEHGSY